MKYTSDAGIQKKLSCRTWGLTGGACIEGLQRAPPPPPLSVFVVITYGILCQEN